MTNELRELTAVSDERAKAHYRAFFDSRVFNFGDYNILVAVGVGACVGERLVIGYRPAPREILICPYEAMNGLHPDRVLQISDMDISHVAVDIPEQSVGIITTQGDSLEFRVDERVAAQVDGETEVLDQTHDVMDFLEFMRIFEAEIG